MVDTSVFSLKRAILTSVSFVAMIGVSSAIIVPERPASATQQIIDRQSPIESVEENNQPLMSAEVAESIGGSEPIRVIVTLKSDEPTNLTGRSSAELIRRQIEIRNDQISVLQSVDGDLEIHHKFRHSPSLAVTVDGTGLQDIVENPLVESVVVDELLSPVMDTSIDFMGARPLHDLGITGSGNGVGAIAVIDTGVSSMHPAFVVDGQSKVVAEACFSSESHGSQSLCPDGTSTMIGPGAGADCPYNVGACGHGTHVAGIAASNKHEVNGSTISGIAPGADIVAIQTFTRFSRDYDVCNLIFESDCALAFLSDTNAALEHVYSLTNTMDIAAVNMSLGGISYYVPCLADPRRDIIQLLEQEGVPVFVASGNNGYSDAISSPACVPEAVAVGSVDRAGFVSNFSNVDDEMIDIMALGDTVFAPYLDDTYMMMSGTSMATPMAAGAWALLKEAFPNENMEQLLYRMKSSGLTAGDRGFPLPVLNVERSYALDTPPEDPYPGSYPEYEPEMQRFAGADRYETAVKVSEAKFPDGSTTVFLVTGGQFPDALSAAPIASSKDHPILLTNPALSAPPEVVLGEISRLGATQVIVIGGESAVPGSQVSHLESLGLEVKRISGSNRYETAAAVSREFIPENSYWVMIATGEDYPDAMAIGSPAAKRNAPILLVEYDRVPEATMAELERIKPSGIIVLGGTDVVAPDVLLTVRSYATEDHRIYGEDRFETSVKIAKGLYYEEITTVYLATGEDFPDALSAVALATADMAPVMLVSRDCMPIVIREFISMYMPDRVVIVGGPDAITEDVERLTLCPRSP